MSLLRPSALLLLGLTLASAAEAAPPDRDRGEDPAARSRAWAQRLYLSEPKARAEAAWNLLALAPASEAPVLEILREPKTREETMVSAIGVAGELAAPEAVGPLLALVEEPRQGGPVRLAAVVALAKIRTPDALVGLADIAAAATWSLGRAVAVVALAMIEAPEAGPAARSAIESPHAFIRQAGFRALTYVPDTRCIPACLEAIESDPDPAVRAAAGAALGAIGDPRTLDRLEGVVARLRPGALRWLLLESMARLGHQKAIEYFLTVLGDRRSDMALSAATILYEIREARARGPLRAVVAASLEGAYEPGVDQLAAHALGVFGDAAAVPVLVRALEQGRTSLRREAARALGRLRAAEAARALLKAANTPERTVRAAVLVALAEIGHESAWEPLGRMVGDRDAFVRYAAAVALERTATPRAIPLLRRLRDDPHDFVRATAEDAIALLEGRAEPLAEDPRAAEHLARLRALDREYALRYLAFELRASQATIGEQWLDPSGAHEVVDTETYYSTCGGSHPPIEYPVRVVADGRAQQVAETYRKQLDEEYRLTELRARAEELRRERRGGGDEEGSGRAGAVPAGARRDR